MSVEEKIEIEAEQANDRLRRGLERSRALVADYRARLIKLRSAALAPRPDKGVFRFDS